MIPILYFVGIGAIFIFLGLLVLIGDLEIWDAFGTKLWKLVTSRSYYCTDCGKKFKKEQVESLKRYIDSHPVLESREE